MINFSSDILQIILDYLDISYPLLYLGLQPFPHEFFTNYMDVNDIYIRFIYIRNLKWLKFLDSITKISRYHKFIALKISAENGFINVLRYLECTHQYNSFDWDRVAGFAAANNKIHILDYIYNSQTNCDLDYIIRYSIHTGNLNSMLWLIGKGANGWENALHTSICNGNKECLDWLFEYMLKSGKEFNMYKFFSNASTYKNDRALKWIYNKKFNISI